MKHSVIVINCIPRSGSNIIWNIIGSSPEVLMTKEEFHVATGHCNNLMTKILMRLNALCPGVPLTHDHIRKSVNGSAQRAIENNTQFLEERGLSQAEMLYLCFKVMGPDNRYNDLIAASFSQVKFIYLVRDPAGICDSFYRRDVSAEEVGRMYRLSMEGMQKSFEKYQGLWVRFEDLAQDTEAVAQEVYDFLSIRKPDDGLYLMKEKKFGKGHEESSRIKHIKVRITLSEIKQRFKVENQEEYLKRVPADYRDKFEENITLLPQKAISE